MHRNQHGFRPGYSCESALTNVVGQIEHTLLQGEQGIGIFCDLAGAFDSISYKAILQAFEKRGFDPLFIGWYSYYLHNRFVTLDLKGVQVTRRCTRGVPQGGVLSPLAFNCATEDGLSLFDADAPTPDSFRQPASAAELAKKRKQAKKPSNTTPTPLDQVTVSTTAFADDLCFYIAGGNTAALHQKAQIVMDKASAWSKSKGMKFSSSKTMPVIFSRLKYKQPPPLVLNGVPLKYGHLAKYLGVYIDSKLTWRDHVDIKLKKAKKFLMTVARLCHPTWGVSPTAAAYYWKQCILPMFTYGCIVWHKVCRFKGVQKELKKFQRLALKMMGPLRHSTPTRGLEVINYFRPIELEVRRLAAEAYIRTNGRDLVPPAALKTTNQSLMSHRQYCHDFLRSLNYPFLDHKSDVCIRKWMWKKAYQVDLESTVKGTDGYGKPKCDAYVHVYTDGSVQRDPTDRYKTEAGGGLYIMGGFATQSNKLGKHVSIFQAELHSIKRTAQWIIKNRKDIDPDWNIAIYTDSLGCLKDLRKPFAKSKLVFQTHQLLNAAAKCCKNLYLRWVKGHSGVVYNDKADELAVAAAQKPDEETVKDLPLLSPGIAKSTLLNAVDQYWNVLFNALRAPERCRQTKQWFPVVNRAKSQKILGYNRSQWGKLNQFMTGHNHLGYHSNIVDPDNKKICLLCDFNYVQDTQHILAECPYFLGLRSNIFFWPFLRPPFDHLPIGKVLEFLHQSEMTALVWEASKG